MSMRRELSNMPEGASQGRSRFGRWVFATNIGAITFGVTATALLLGSLFIFGRLVTPRMNTSYLRFEVTSPDGTQTARLWCEAWCDVPEVRVLTISPQDRLVSIDRSLRSSCDCLGAGNTPEEDVVTEIESSVIDDLRWKDSKLLEITGADIKIAARREFWKDWRAQRALRFRQNTVSFVSWKAAQ